MLCCQFVALGALLLVAAPSVRGQIYIPPGIDIAELDNETELAYARDIGALRAIVNTTAIPVSGIHGQTESVGMPDAGWTGMVLCPLNGKMCE